jgi:hypothetical protein
MLPSLTDNHSLIRCAPFFHLKKPRGIASIIIVSFFQFWTSILSFWTVLPHTLLSSVSLGGSPLLFLCLLALCHDQIPRILLMSWSYIDLWGEFLELDRDLFRPLNIRLFYCSIILDGLDIRGRFVPNWSQINSREGRAESVGILDKQNHGLRHKTWRWGWTTSPTSRPRGSGESLPQVLLNDHSVSIFRLPGKKISESLRNPICSFSVSWGEQEIAWNSHHLLEKLKCSSVDMILKARVSASNIKTIENNRTVE